MSAWQYIAAGLVLAVVACGEIEVREQPLPLRSQIDFESQVQPYVALGCGSLDCHGDKGRALRLYSEHGLRLTDALRDQPVSSEEIAANVTSFVGVSPEIESDWTQHLALLKALDPKAGGYAHEGEEIWTSTDDAGYQCILAWLQDRSSDADAVAACADAYDEVRID